MSVIVTLSLGSGWAPLHSVNHGASGPSLSPSKCILYSPHTAQKWGHAGTRMERACSAGLPSLCPKHLYHGPRGSRGLGLRACSTTLTVQTLLEGILRRNNTGHPPHVPRAVLPGGGRRGSRQHLAKTSFSRRYSGFRLSVL